MKKIVLHIVAIAIAFVIFYTSTGVSIHHLYCYCKGEFSTVVFHLDGDWPGDLTIHESCCTPGTCQAGDKNNDRGCTDCEIETVIFTAEYLFLGSKFELHPPLLYYVHSPLGKLYKSVCNSLSLIINNNKDPFPDFISKQPFLQVFLC
jgi:hypothetical protein